VSEGRSLQLYDTEGLEDEIVKNQINIEDLGLGTNGDLSANKSEAFAEFLCLRIYYVKR